MGRTWVEASLYKVPCIASNVGGIPEIIENGSDGILILPGDNAAIAEAVLALLEDRQKMKTLGETAFLRIPPHFVMADTVQKIANIINQTLKTASVQKNQ
jgi:glycosyltransferase involved in cell wall biosynthesis